MLYIKAFHIIFMVTWFAGLFYLPRLFVYHAMSDDQISNDRFKIMERKLYYGIMTPGAILTTAFGVWMIAKVGLSNYGTWLHIKLALVSILIIYHVYCGKCLIDFKHDRNTRSHVYYRWLNEFPVLLIIPIVILAVVRPF
ncbi:MAG: protoporphyrinogen oxidase HemJ [Gammaproteobacteria bacterium]